MPSKTICVNFPREVASGSDRDERDDRGGLSNVILRSGSDEESQITKNSPESEILRFAQNDMVVM